MKTLFFSAEDGRDTIRRRIAAICRADQLDPVEIDKNLIVLDATDASCLFEETSSNGVKQGKETKTYDKLKQFINDEGIRFLIVDNASDTFGANPIDRQSVTQFIRALTRLVRDAGGAVLLLAHVNKMTSKAGKNQTDTEGYADSAAWHNASRSRLFLNTTSEGNLTLEHQKNNLGIKQPVLNIAFRDDGSSFHVIGEEQLQKAKAEKAANLKLSQSPLLKLIHEYYVRGEWISPKENSHTCHTHAKLSKEKSYPFKSDKTGKADCFTVLRECEREGLLTKEAYDKTDQRKHDIRWQLTNKGIEFINETA
jgi:RecA-family ATPase